MQNIEQIYKEYFDMINKYLFCLTKNRDLAEELTQETFYRAIQKIDSYNGNCKMSVWLCQIAKNIWYNYYKKEKRIVVMTEEELLRIEDKETIDNLLISQEEKNILYEKIQKLDIKTREVMYLRIVRDLSFKDIGDVVGKTENWARVIFFRGKVKLKEGNCNEK